MTTRTTVRSWRAMAVAGVILAGTCYILFQDILEGTPVGVVHVLTALALLIATVAGHQIVPTFKDGRYALTLAMIVLAVGAITYIGIVSGARDAEGLRAKAEHIDGSNGERQRIGKLREEAQAMLSTALKEVAAKCKGGVGKDCKGVEKNPRRLRGGRQGPQRGPCEASCTADAECGLQGGGRGDRAHGSH